MGTHRLYHGGNHFFRKAICAQHFGQYFHGLVGMILVCTGPIWKGSDVVHHSSCKKHVVINSRIVGARQGFCKRVDALGMAISPSRMLEVVARETFSRDTPIFCGVNAWLVLRYPEL